MFDSLLSLIAPHDCLICGAEGAQICRTCASSLRRVPERCYNCHSLSAGGRTCQKCRRLSRLHSVRVATFYTEHGKEIIWKLKFEGVQSLAKELAPRLGELLPPRQDIIITHAPTATSRIRRRGYDQAALLARATARHARVRYVPFLVRLGQQEQLGANRLKRKAQLEDALRVRYPEIIKGAHIIVVDDVLTTGATLEACAAALRAAGAKRVDGLAFAQA